MRNVLLSPLFFGALGLCASVAAPGALADTIYLTSGESIEDVKVSTEGLSLVIYKKGSSEKEVATEEVLRIEFESMPELLEDAEFKLAEDDVAGAIYDYSLYVDGMLGGNEERRYPWAPAYAAHRALELQLTLGDPAATIAAADKLLTNFAESRYVPSALLTKAEVQGASDPVAALATLDVLSALAGANGLSDRWKLEAQLRGALIDPAKSLEQRLEALVALGRKAAAVPAVGVRVKLAQAETQLELADKVPDKRDEYLDGARDLYEGLRDEEDLEPGAKAGLLTGLGDVTYLEAGTDPVQLAVARDYYLRVVVLYPDETAYVPKAMAFAALTSAKLATEAEGDPEKARAKKLASRMLSRYPGSRWADIARAARRAAR